MFVFHSAQLIKNCFYVIPKTFIINNFLRGFYSLRMEFQEKEAELETLLDQIDEYQSIVDKLNEDISEKELDIRELQKEFEIKKSRETSKNLVGYGTEINLDPAVYSSIFSGEHLDYLVEKQNILRKLSEEIEELQVIIDPLQEEVEILQTDSTNLRQVTSHLQKDLDRKSSERKQLERTWEISKEQLRGLSSSIIAQQNTASRCEITLRNTRKQADRITAKTDEKGEITQNIKTLDTLISLTETRISSLEDDLANMRERNEDYETKLLAEVEKHKSIANWSSESARLETELKNADKQVSEANSVLKSKLAEATALESHYKRLEPVIRKWKGEITASSVSEDTESMSDLLKKLKDKMSGSVHLENQRAAELDSLRMDNYRLEMQISRRQEELERAMIKFENDQAKIKAEIQKARTSSFEDEHRIVDQMSQLSLKMAQKKLTNNC